MTYYHVLVQGNNRNKKYYELDKTDLSEIKEEIVIPFLKGDRFMFDGCFFVQAEIERILIKESAYTSQMYADALNKKYSDYPIYFKREDIVSDEDKYTTDITGRIVKECRSLLQGATSKSETPTVTKPKAPMDKSKVFIVHGHDGEAKQAVARFVENLGLKAIILSEQASAGNTIIEKIEEYTNVGFGIVLYTPCDLGASQEKKDELKPRARQNVVFEHGYLIGKIGRKNVCALLKGDIEIPNDISGVVYIKMEGEKEWKCKVADEMKACGYDIDLNKI